MRTEAHGRLRAPDEPIKLRRKNTQGTEELWHVDAVTEFDVTAEDGSTIPRRTVGKVKFPGGGTGSFHTDYLGMSSDGRIDSSGAWQRPPGLPPGQTGTQTVKILPGGPGNREWERHVVDLKTGDTDFQHEVTRQRLDSDGSFHIENSTEHKVSVGGRQTVDTTREDIRNNGAGRHWVRETTATGVGTTTERGEFVVNGTSASATSSTTHPDNSVTIVTTTWDTSTGRGTEHTTTVDSSGKATEKTVEGTVNPGNWAQRPGDAGPILQPDSSSSGEEKKDDDKDKDKDTDHTDDDEQPDTGDDETETSDDGSGDDDSGGYPGLGWDGGANGPLELLPAAARAAMGRFNDPNHPLDSLGDDSGLVDLLAAALAEAAGKAGPSDSGHGEDTGDDPLHGVTPEALAKAARDAPPVDPEWGDWSNPKAHAVFIDRVGINVGVEIGRSSGLEKLTTVDIASALHKFT